MAEESWQRGIEETGYRAPEKHRPCANNCGFFGSSTTMNLCSKCYRDLHLKESLSIKSSAMEKPLDLVKELDQAVPLHDGVVTISAPSRLPSSSSADSGPAMASSTLRSIANRCFGCKKRVGLMGFKCRCGNTFCASHRLPEQHVCTFDFKAAGRVDIARANPVVVASKLKKI